MVKYTDTRYKTLQPEHKLLFAIITQARRDLKQPAHRETAAEFLHDVGLLAHAQAQGMSRNVKKN